MTKRFWALSLALFLCFGLCSSAFSMAVTVRAGGGEDGEDLRVTSAAVCGGQLYLLTEANTVLRMDPLTQERTELGQCLYVGYATTPEEVTAQRENAPDLKDAPAIGHLFSDGATLYGVAAATGEWFTLLDAAGAYAPKAMDSKLDLSALFLREGDNITLPTVTSLFAQEGYLYYAAQVYLGITPSTISGRVHLETGEAATFKTQFIKELLPWKDGKLLALQYDEANAYNMQTQEQAAPEYGLFDPEADVFTSLGKLETDSRFGGMNVSGLAGDPATNNIFYFAGSRVMGIDLSTGESRVSAYTGEGVFGGYSEGPVFLAGNVYLKTGYRGLDAYPLDSEALKNGALRVFGEFGSEAHRSFRTNHPDIPVEVADDFTNDLEALTTAMVSESDAYDVLFLNMSYMPVERLREKGYCADLSQFPDVVALADQMNPKYTNLLRQDGKPYAVPAELSAHSPSVNLRLWTEELGLAEEDLPKTMLELYDFIANWDYDYADDHPDLRLLGMVADKQTLVSLMLDQYISYMQQQGEDLKFDTPLMRKLLTAIEALDGETLSGGLDENSQEFWRQPALFNPFYQITSFEVGTYEPDYRALFLPLDEGCDPVVGGTLSVLVVNPKSKRLEQAGLYVLNYLQNLPKAGANIILFPAHNDPVEDKNTLQNMKQWDDLIAKQQELLAAAEDSEKPALQAEMQNYEDRKTELEKYR